MTGEQRRRTTKARQERIVAELGRPETPEETAARKAASRRRHRENQTFSNLAAAIVVCLGLVLVMVLIVPRPELPEDEPIDVAAGASQAEPALGTPLVAPKLDDAWRANAAEVRGRGVVTWYVGYVTPSDEFLSVTQARDADPTWLAIAVDGRTSSGERTIGGVRWQEFPAAESAERTFVTERSPLTFVVAGTADDTELEQLLSSLGEGMAGLEATS